MGVAAIRTGIGSSSEQVADGRNVDRRRPTSSGETSVTTIASRIVTARSPSSELARSKDLRPDRTPPHGCIVLRVADRRIQMLGCRPKGDGSQLDRHQGLTP